MFHFHEREPPCDCIYLLSPLGAEHIVSVAGYGSFVHSLQQGINQVRVFCPFLLAVIELDMCFRC